MTATESNARYEDAFRRAVEKHQVCPVVARLLFAAGVQACCDIYHQKFAEADERERKATAAFHQLLRTHFEINELTYDN